MENRNYKVSGKKLLPKPCNRNRNHVRKLGRSLRLMNLNLPPRSAKALRDFGESQ